MDALFQALGAGFASALGMLVLGVVAGMIVILWDWRLALAGVLFLQFGVGTLLAQVHHVPGILIGGQVVAIVLATAMLALAATSTPATGSLRQAANWPLRLVALLSVIGAWWFVDPGYTLPLFSRAETGLLIWIAICGLVLVGFSGNPILTGVALLLWCIPMYAAAAVLLPGSGLAVMVGIAELLLALACGYLALVEPAGVTDPAWRTRFPLPHAGTRRSVSRTLPTPAAALPAAALPPSGTLVAGPGADRVLEKPA